MGDDDRSNDAGQTPESRGETSDPGVAGNRWSRRHFLAAIGAVGGTVAAGTVLWRAVQGDDDDGSKRKAADPKLNAAAGQPEVRTMHFAIGAKAVSAAAVIHVDGKEYPLVAHDDASRADLLADAAGLGVDPSVLTHYADSVELPPVVLQVLVLDYGDPDVTDIDADTRYLGSHLHIPTAAKLDTWQKKERLAAAVRGMRDDPALREVVGQAAVGLATTAQVRDALDQLGAAPDATSVGGSPERWKLLGVTGGSVPTTPDQAAALAPYTDLAFESAVTLVMKHPEVLSMDPTGASITMDILTNSPAVATLAGEVSALLGSVPDSSIGSFEPVVDDAGNPLSMPDDVPASDGPLGDAPMHVLKVDPQLLAPLGAAAAEVIVAVKQHDDLSGYSWQPTSAPPPAVEPPPAGLQAGNLKVTLSGEAVTSTKAGVKLAVTGTDTSKNEFTMEVSNDFLRHLVVGVAYFDDQDRCMPVPADFDYGPSKIYQELNFGAEHLKVLNVVPSAMTYLGVTAPGLNKNPYTVRIPPNAKKARLYLCGMTFQLYNEEVMSRLVDQDGKRIFGDEISVPIAWYGTLFSFILDLAVPAVSLISATRTLGNLNRDAYKSIWEENPWGAGDLQKDFVVAQATLKDLLYKALGVAAFCVVGGATAATIKQVKSTDTWWKLVEDAGPAVLKLATNSTIAKQVWKQYLKRVEASVATKALPFLGEALAAVAAFENTVKLATTSVELMVAPATMVAELSVSYGATVTLKPDAGDADQPGGKFLPNDAVRYELQYRLDGKAPIKITGAAVDFKAGVESFQIPVVDVPVGSRISWDITLFSKDGWQIGAGAVGPLDNGDYSKLPEAVELTVKRQLIPVNAKSSLERAWTIQGGASGPAIVADAVAAGTVTDLNCAEPAGLCALAGITVGTRLGVAGYVWSTGGKYYVRNLGTGGDTAAVWNGSGPYDQRPLLVYDSMTADAEGAHNFLLEPTDTGYVVRHISVASAAEAPNLGLSDGVVGRFTGRLDDAAYNPHGFIVGVTSGSGRLQILPLDPPNPADPARLGPPAAYETDLAPPAALHAGTGDREGLLRAPSLVTCMKDGTIVALSSGDQFELRAFAVSGAPSPRFKSKSTSILALADATERRTHVGLSVDGGGFLYVLSYATEDDPNSWAVDVYDPEAAERVYRTTGINAGRMAVDFWRTAFTLNYQPILDGGGKPYTSALVPVPEPSVSSWITATPQG